jgi:putative FmdB family regulatory protein
MIYVFDCDKCNNQEEVYRRVKDRDEPYACKCGEFMERRVISSKPTFNTGKGSSFPGLCKSLPGGDVYVKSKAHFRELCKERDAGEPVAL